MLYMQRRGK